MVSVIKKYYSIRDQIPSLQSNIQNELGIEEQAIPNSSLGMIFNDITLCIEILSAFNSIWRRKVTINSENAEEIKRIKNENGQRVIQIQKLIFISSVSSFENVAKTYLVHNPSKLGEFKGWIHLYDIMKRTLDKNKINKDEFDLWLGVNNFRRLILHDNAISDFDGKYTYPDCELTFNKGEMTQSNLLLIPCIMDWFVNAIVKWIHSIES